MTLTSDRFWCMMLFLTTLKCVVEEFQPPLNLLPQPCAKADLSFLDLVSVDPPYSNLTVGFCNTQIYLELRQLWIPFCVFSAYFPGNSLNFPVVFQQVYLFFFSLTLTRAGLCCLQMESVTRKAPKPPNFSHTHLPIPSQPHRDIPLSYNAWHAGIFQRHSQLSLYRSSWPLLIPCSAHIRDIFYSSLWCHSKQNHLSASCPIEKPKYHHWQLLFHIGDIQSSSVGSALLSHRPAHFLAMLLSLS